MASQIVNYQCPACTGPLHFKSSSGLLECDYCSSKFTVQEINEYYQTKNETAENSFFDVNETEWDLSQCTADWNQDAMKAYICPSCSAELICDEYTAATRCPYCGNPTVVPGQFKEELKPEYIIPFKLSHQDAENALKKYYKGKRFLPKEFADKNTIQEIQGVYVPFWMFDGTAHVNITFDGTRSHKTRIGDYMITDTDHFDIHRVGTVTFEKVPVDASKRMPDAHMDAIEPFHYSEMTEFSMSYLPGFLAERFSLSVDECKERADLRIENSSVDLMKQDVTNYDSISTKQKYIQIERGKVHYGLLPVYLLATRYNNQEYLFAMNGQTGKFVGNLPVDQKKYWMTFATMFAGIAFAAGTLLMILF